MTDLPLTPLRSDELTMSSKMSSKAFVARFDDLPVPSRSRAGLNDYLREHAQEIRSLVKSNGCLLLRGLPMQTAAHYQEALEALGYDLFRNNNGGASPRSNITEKTFVSTEAPSPFIISPHTEMCYQSTRPGMISFFCELPATKYSETPLFDFHGLWSDLNPDLRERLSREGLLYKRFIFGKKSFFNFRKTWHETFQTDDRRVVEAFLKSEGMRFEWDAEGNLATELALPAVLPDPVSGLPCISITMFNADTFIHNFRLFRDRYNPLLRRALEWFVRHEYGKPNTFLKVLYGSGKAFTSQEAAEIQRAAWSNAIVFPWQVGDMVLIDNIRFGHARMNVRKPRRLVAAMADRYDVRELMSPVRVQPEHKLAA